MGIRLLIADDEDIIRNGIAKYIQLHTDRFEPIYLAANGQEAIDLIFRNRVDIMLLDVQMPLKDGIDVMQEASRAGILPCTLILSGYDEFRYAQQAIRYGAKDYLLKPVRSSDILKKVHEVADELFGVEKSEEEGAADNRNIIVESAREYMKEHYYEDLTLAGVADKVGITPGYLSTLFSQKMNIKFVDYLNELRVEYACNYLRRNDLKTYEIAYKVGFHDEKYFSKVFKKITGQSPSGYRKNNGGI